MYRFEIATLVFSFLILISIIMSKLSFRFGIPTLLIFLVIGMISGSDGIGKIEFDNPELAQELGIFALVYILFAGGLETEWKKIFPVIREGISLSTIGVIFTAACVSIFSYYFLNIDWKEAFLLGSVVSSTDAASVFNLLRTSGVQLKERITHLLELESGSNDPMAVILTTTSIGLIVNDKFQLPVLIGNIVWQILMGGLLGIVFGYLFTQFINAINLEYDGLYTVIFIASGIFIYSSSSILGGNGFLSVYIAGVYIGNHYFIHKKSIIRFMDGLGWLMQIIMFLVLGLLVFPSQLKDVFLSGLIFSFFLIFIARPFGVFVSLIFSDIPFKEKAFVSWVGLRGAAPIILATFPLTAGLQNSNMIFNLVFFTVLTSLLIQGTSLRVLSSKMGLSTPIVQKFLYPFEFENRESSEMKLEEYLIPMNSSIDGKTIRELQIPEDALITMIIRGENYIIPTGRTEIKSLDVLLVLVNRYNEEIVGRRLRGDLS